MYKKIILSSLLITVLSAGESKENLELLLLKNKETQKELEMKILKNELEELKKENSLLLNQYKINKKTGKPKIKKNKNKDIERKKEDYYSDEIDDLFGDTPTEEPGVWTVPLIFQHNFDVHSYDLSSMKRKEKRLISKMFKELENNENFSDNSKILSLLAKDIKEILADSLISKNKKIRELSIDILDDKDLLEEAFKDILEDKEDSNAQYKFFYMEDLKKYEKKLFNTFKNLKKEDQDRTIDSMIRLEIPSILEYYSNR